MAKEGHTGSRLRRHRRVRTKVIGSQTRPRLCVFRSLRHIYAQVVDDSLGHTLASASTLEAENKGQLAGKTKIEQAAVVGSVVAQRAMDQGVSQVVFDRGGYKYHGRVKSLADAARKAGLQF